MSAKKKDDEKTKKIAAGSTAKKSGGKKGVKAGKGGKTPKAVKVSKHSEAKTDALLTPVRLYSPPEFPFHNRELSWMDFNSRVLEEAFEKDNPVLERVKFLAITASNLDEFFMVRVAGVMDRMHSKPNVPDESGMTPVQQFEKLSEKYMNLPRNSIRVCTALSCLPSGSTS